MIIQKWTRAIWLFPYDQSWLNKDGLIETQHRWMIYYTDRIEEHFNFMSIADFEKLIIDFNRTTEKELDILNKYNAISVVSARLIKELHKIFFVYKWIYFNIQDTRNFIIQNWLQDWNTFITLDERSPERLKEINEVKKIEQEEKESTLKDIEEHTPSNTIVKINRQAIRNITWYSFKVIPKWSKDWKEIYLWFQEKILNDTESTLILLDKSRQLWGSFTIWELITELSFVPWEDTLVWAFVKKTTDVIRNYMVKNINKFNTWTFEVFKSEWFILNVKSWTKIYFRTLDDGWDSSRWLTVKNIIIDEAQLVDDYAFDDVLEPMMSTTWGRMFLIWTASKFKKYFYKRIMEARKALWYRAENTYIWAKYTNDYWELISYYKLDININPLINPILKAKILANKDKPSYQREWFCNWNSWDDNFVEYKNSLSELFPEIIEDWYCVITFDPAKSWTDRSAYCISYIYNWHIYILQSWFIPTNMKSKWSNQIKYYKKSIINVFKQKWFKKTIYWVDIRGIGEWFTNEWGHQIKEPIIEIWYTGGESEKLDWFKWRVSKSILLTNMQDIFDEDKITINSILNKDLLGEIDWIYETEDRYGRVWIKTETFDDIFNAMATNLFIINRKWLLKRSLLSDWWNQNKQFEEWNKEFVDKKTTIIYKKNKRLI